MRRALLVAAVAIAALAGCGTPDELSRKDAVKLANAREGIENAVQTERDVRSPAKLRRIRSEIRRLVATGSFEAEELDEFGLATLGELQQVLPSVVETDADGVPTDLDRPALREFQRYAGSDPARALLGPVREEVGVLERVIRDSDAGPDTRIPPRDASASGDETVEEYLHDVGRKLRPLWPRSADRVGTVLSG